MDIRRDRFSILPWLAWTGLYLALAAWFWAAYRSLKLGVEWAAWLYPEDHFFETLGAASLFLAAVISFAACLRARRGQAPLARTGLYLIMALVFLFAAGQEIGWGQRILHPVQPEGIAQPNSGAQGANSPHPFDHYLSLLLVALAVTLPVALLASPALRRFSAERFPLHVLGVGPLFILNQLLSMVARGQYRPWYRYKIVRLPQAIQEIKESNFEVLCAVLALIALWELGGYLKRRRVSIQTDPSGSV